MRIPKALISAVLLTLTAAAAAVPAEAATAAPRWTATWGTATQWPTPSTPWYGTNWSREGFADHTLRQIIRISASGTAVRIRLSNIHGTTPLRIEKAAVANALQGAAAGPGLPLTFDGGPDVVIPPGRERYSDAIRLRTHALQRLAITLRFTAPTGPATFHHFAQATSYRAVGDHLTDREPAAFTERSNSWYYLTGVEVSGGPHASIALFGDSLTDGVGSTVDADNRYPDQLAERLAARHRPLGVVNAGIGGNRLLSDSPEYGQNGLARFERDVLDRHGIRSVIIMQGVNDLAEWNKPRQATATEIIAGHRRLIRAARARGLTVVGATIMPIKGSGLAYSEQAEKVRDQVNHWIRTSGAYHQVADFDRVVRQPTDPDLLRPEYDSGDGIHLNDAGYDALAQAVDLHIPLTAA
ncbi:SGNH/GDSL hydrolase family protein [Micromonospora sp. KC723]|uniref:SGNH/GDSL hydrolase family protein n=1 Tax=Micromonospora sp. KC723 TaxID=2530381 RepID=UPI00104B77BC|nr:SGNH/GDSL hydrolase family protein [Micromonospora sp. KC723]TDB72833.1 SGNH/GDSL hydrolase family protein [Micromonospora sp. KC723]